MGIDADSASLPPRGVLGRSPIGYRLSTFCGIGPGFRSATVGYAGHSERSTCPCFLLDCACPSIRFAFDAGWQPSTTGHTSTPPLNLWACFTSGPRPQLCIVPASTNPLCSSHGSPTVAADIGGWHSHSGIRAIACHFQVSQVSWGDETLEGMESGFYTIPIYQSP